MRDLELGKAPHQLPRQQAELTWKIRLPGEDRGGHGFENQHPAGTQCAAHRGPKPSFEEAEAQDHVVARLGEPKAAEISRDQIGTELIHVEAFSKPAQSHHAPIHRIHLIPGANHELGVGTKTTGDIETTTVGETAESFFKKCGRLRELSRPVSALPLSPRLNHQSLPQY